MKKKYNNIKDRLQKLHNLLHHSRTSIEKDTKDALQKILELLDDIYVRIGSD